MSIGGTVHNELKHQAKKMLLDREFEDSDIKYEYKVTVGKKKYIVDVVAFKNGELHTAIECGGVQNKDKLTQLKALFEVVEHIPYLDNAIVTKMREYEDKIQTLERENHRLKLQRLQKKRATLPTNTLKNSESRKKTLNKEKTNADIIKSADKIVQKRRELLKGEEEIGRRFNSLEDTITEFGKKHVKMRHKVNSYSARFSEINALLGNGGIDVHEYIRRLEKITDDWLADPQTPTQPIPIEVLAKQ